LCAFLSLFLSAILQAGQPAPLAGYRSSSGDAEDSDCSAQLPTRENSGPIGAPSSPKAAKGPSGDARTISPPVKRRDKKTNAEASKLRNHISMTDYEIQRLQKSLKKRNTNLQALEAQHSLSEENQQAVLDYNSEIQALHTQIVRLTARQQAYKDEYLALTGECCLLLTGWGAFSVGCHVFSPGFKYATPDCINFFCVR
jgi:hypothetical protein